VFSISLRGFVDWLARGAVVVALLAAAVVRADVADNYSCTTAEAAGSATPADRVQGALDESGDVDYYSFTARPGAFLTIRVRSEAGSDLVSEIFDSSCNEILYFNDDYSADSLDPGFNIRVPADGVFILGVSGWPDVDFIGEHDQTGPYRIAFRRPTGLVFSGTTICTDVPDEGAWCKVNIRIDNRASSAFKGRAWYLVTASDIGGEVPFAIAQLDSRNGELEIPSQGSVKLPAAFKITKFAPSASPDPAGPLGASYCVDLFVSKGSDPLFKTRAYEFIGCVLKGGSAAASADAPATASRVPTREHAVRMKVRGGAD
jgi:hypothetical protein